MNTYYHDLLTPLLSINKNITTTIKSLPVNVPSQ